MCRIVLFSRSKHLVGLRQRDGGGARTPEYFSSGTGTHVQVGAFLSATGRLTLLQSIARVEAGEEIIIARNRQPVAKLVPIRRTRPQRQFEATRGRAGADAAFFTLLPPDELRAWE